MQVMQGKVSDVEAVRSRFDSWMRDLAPSAEGWLGTTAGVTPDGEFVAAVRFESDDAARRNSDRTEQGAWWAETEKVFDGDVDFHDYPNVELLMGGGSDDAGFVQLIQGTYTGEGSPADVIDDDELSASRPDIVGGTIGWDNSGHFTELVYFTSEEAAREGEKQMPDDPVGERVEEMMAAVEGLRFLDLTEPVMESP